MFDSLESLIYQKEPARTYERMADHFAFVTQIKSTHDEISEQAKKLVNKHPEDINNQFIIK